MSKQFWVHPATAKTDNYPPSKWEDIRLGQIGRRFQERHTGGLGPAFRHFEDGLFCKAFSWKPSGAKTFSVIRLKRDDYGRMGGLTSPYYSATIRYYPNRDGKYPLFSPAEACGEWWPSDAVVKAYRKGNK